MIRKSTCGCLWAAMMFSFIALSPAIGAAIDCNTLPPRDAVSLTLDRQLQLSFGGGTDCWGWTAPDGTEYAIMGTWSGVTVVNALTGAVIGTVPGPTGGCGGTRWRDMVTYGDYLYCVSECTGTNEGMMIIDLKFVPDSLHFLGTHTPTAERTSHNLAIDTAMGFAYAVKRSAAGFRVIDLADPENPVDVDWVRTFDLHDMYARNDTVWAAEGNMGSFSIWDMADKQNAQLIARVQIPSSGYVHNIWPTSDGRYVVTTEETAFKTIKIWNTESLGGIQLVAQYIAPSQLAHNAQIWGDYIYISHYQSGVAIVDITTPECPVEVARYDTYTAGEEAGFAGCWGVFEATHNGMVYGSNGDGRLFILQSSIAQVDFTGTPRLAYDSAVVQFTDLSATTPTGWTWDFGDGGASAAQHPTHTYGPGLYDVSLTTATPLGAGQSLKTNYITVLAETLSSGAIEVPRDTRTFWEISCTNSVPITEFVLPITLSNVPAVVLFDSISTIGTRTEYFELNDLVFDNRFAGEMAVRLRADNGGGASPLPPGNGPVARVWLRTKINASAGQTSAMSVEPLWVYELEATTLSTAFTPAFSGGTLTIVFTATVGDFNGDANVDVIDVTALIDYVFRSGPAPDPLFVGDTNCNGEINILDVIALIDFVFRSGPSPCS